MLGRGEGHGGGNVALRIVSYAAGGVLTHTALEEVAPLGVGLLAVGAALLNAELRRGGDAVVFVGLDTGIIGKVAILIGVAGNIVQNNILYPVSVVVADKADVVTGDLLNSKAVIVHADHAAVLGPVIDDHILGQSLASQGAPSNVQIALNAAVFHQGEAKTANLTAGNHDQLVIIAFRR